MLTGESKLPGNFLETFGQLVHSRSVNIHHIVARHKLDHTLAHQQVNVLLDFASHMILGLVLRLKSSSRSGLTPGHVNKSDALLRTNDLQTASPSLG